MKARITYLVICLLMTVSLKAQIKIGDNPQNLDPASVLELESNSRVLVITRMTTIQMENTSPLRGAVVYNTDTQCVHFYDGALWINLCDRPDEQTFTTDAIVNFSPTMIITPDVNGTNFNFEVGEIRGENIVDTSINGSVDIQEGSITGLQLQDATVSFDKLAEGTSSGELLQWNGTEWVLIDESAITVTEIDGVVGNEILDAADGTLVRTGLGDNANPFVLDVSVGGITNVELGPNAVTSDKILNGEVGTDDIANDAVTNIKLDKANIPLSGFDAAAADVDLGSNKLINVTDPTNLQDAATKNYVDNTVGAINTLADGTIYLGDAANTAQEVAISGDATMTNTGVLTIEDDAVTTIKLLDANVTNAKLDKANIPLSGFGTATANVTMGGFQINNLLDPALAQDAATRNYVDNTVGAINTLADGTIYLGDAANTAQEVAISGDATMTNTGVLTIEDDAVTTIKLLDANVTNAKLDKANIPLSGFGTATANVTMGGFQINNLLDPALAQDAATRNYVDNTVGAINTLADGTIYLGDAANTAQEVAISGDATMTNTGVLTIEDDAVTTIKLLDANVTNAKLDKANIPLSGFGAATANVTMGGFQINNLLDPALAQDAATRNYVDNTVGAINTLADGTIYLGDAANTAQEVAISGDATMTNTGVLTIEDDAVTTIKLLDANVTPAKVEPSATDGQVLTTVSGAAVWQSPYHAIGKANASAITNSSGVASITPLGTGNFQVNFSTNASSADYVIQLTLFNAGADVSIEVTAQTANNFTVLITDSSGTPIDAEWYFTVIDF